MDQETIINFIINTSWPLVIFKFGSVIFALGYLIYAFVYFQQQQRIIKNTLIYYNKLVNPSLNIPPKNTILTALAILQIFFGLFLLVFSIFFL